MRWAASSTISKRPKSADELPRPAWICAALMLLSGCQEHEQPASTASGWPGDQASRPAGDPTSATGSTYYATPSGATYVPGDRPRTQAEAAPVVPDRIRDITFDDIKFDMEKGGEFKRSMLTPPITRLDGKPIRIRGYILPSYQQSGITQFVLVRDNLECCFGPGTRCTMRSPCKSHRRPVDRLHHGPRLPSRAPSSSASSPRPDGPLAIYFMEAIAVGGSEGKENDE